MGGAWFDEYIGSKSNDEIYNLALSELKKHLNIQIDPDIHEVNVLKVRYNLSLIKLITKYLLIYL